jgi:hypothetical protein
MFKFVIAAAAASVSLAVAPTAAFAATPVSINYTGTISGMNTTFNVAYNENVQFTGFSTEEDFADGDITITDFSAIYAGVTNNYGTGVATFNGSLFNVIAGSGANLINIAFDISPVVRSGTQFNTAYNATLSGSSVGAFGSATITGGSGTLRGVSPAIPEPGTWALMLLGFGAVGVSMRRRRSSTMIAQFA